MAETETDTSADALAPLVTAATLDTSGAADIAPATTFTPAGAPVQDLKIDVDHPAVDNDLRKNTTVDMNRIDFNDPRPTSVEGAVPETGAKPAKA